MRSIHFFMLCHLWKMQYIKSQPLILWNLQIYLAVFESQLHPKYYPYQIISCFIQLLLPKRENCCFPLNVCKVEPLSGTVCSYLLFLITSQRHCGMTNIMWLCVVVVISDCVEVAICHLFHFQMTSSKLRSPQSLIPVGQAQRISNWKPVFIRCL